MLKHPVTTRRIEVLDLHGSLIMRKTNTGLSETHIDLRDKAAGIYMIRVDGNVYSMKVLKK